MLTSSTTRENKDGKKNVQKSVMHVQSCCFANLKLLLFCRSRCRRSRRCLRSLVTIQGRRQNNTDLRRHNY